jgi:hypothetical protein
VIHRVLLVIVLLVAGCGVRPSSVVEGGPAPTVAAGATLFLVSGGHVTPVLRPKPDSSDLLALLAAGPTAVERDQGYTSEVPAGVALSAAASEVSVSVDVRSLSALAVDQIVCTAAPDSTPVTLVGGGASRGPQVCPVR